MNRHAPVTSIAVLALLGIAVSVPAQDTRDRVDSIFDRIEESGAPGLWQGIHDLDALGSAAIPDVRRGVTRADGFVRIAAAKVLYTNKYREEALQALARVVDGRDGAAKKAAADMTASLVGADSDLKPAMKAKIAEDLQKQAKSTDDPLAQVALLRAVWHLTGGAQWRELRRILGSTERQDVREEAALALAEMDRFTDARPVLMELRHEPSERGRMARAYLRIKELGDSLEDYVTRTAAQGGGTGKYDFRMLEEAIDKLKTGYYDPEKVDPKKIIEAAVRGACASLDPYTSYMDEKMINQLKKEELGGVYGGIGARVAMRKDKGGNAWLTIVEPIFQGPAYKAGLRTNDTITEVEGETTRGKELFELVRKLRGLEGTEVAFKVMRRGWPKAREFKIKRGSIQLETTMSRMLPGKVGYIKLVTFGENDIRLVAAAVLGLKAQGMKALIFDLRGNSGGYLRTAQKLAGYFLEKGKDIVHTRGRGRPEEIRYAEGGSLTDVPLVMLIDGGSASASEILAGSLRDHKRAVLVGEKTFGKGSVQDMKYFKTSGNKSALKLTISKWYLPSGASVEGDTIGEGGIEPDIPAEEPELDYWKVAEFERLRALDAMHAYVAENYPKHRALLEKLAENDGLDPSRYPGFDALFEKLGTKASKDDVRELLRDLVRSRVQDERGRPLYFDFQTDYVLQRGILEACKRASLDASGVPEYETFSKNVEKVSAER